MKRTILTLILVLWIGIIAVADGIEEPYPVFNQDEKTFLFESSEKLSMDYGYDSYTESYCFFNISVELPTSKTDKKTETSAFIQYIDKVSPEMIWQIYVKLNGNIAALNYLDRYYTKKKEWKYVNYIRKTMLPVTLKYHKTLEEYMLKNKVFNEKFLKGSVEIKESKKAAILSQKKRVTVVDEYQ
jgi:hypothetical protein